jgi:hypothetical protein
MELNLKNISDFIMGNYPDSCLAHNNKYFDYYDEELLEECDKFFYHEVLRMCGCGTPENTRKIIKIIMNAQNQKDYCVRNKMINEILGIDRNQNDMYNGLIQFILYTLDDKGLIEHGSSINGSWLTELGKMYLYILNKIDLDSNN